MQDIEMAIPILSVEIIYIAQKGCNTPHCKKWQPFVRVCKWGHQF